MPTRRTTEPTVEPITLAEAKIHLRVDGTAEDAYITTLIKTARAACEHRIQRTVPSTGLTLTLDKFPSAIKLEGPPIVSVASLVYIDTAGVSQTLNPADYIVDTISEPGFIVPAPDKAWPATQDRINAVNVVYTAGYTSVPEPLVAWMQLAIGDMYDNRSRSAAQPAVVQGFADSLLDTYRIFG